jgi:hypothetical protein
MRIDHHHTVTQSLCTLALNDPLHQPQMIVDRSAAFGEIRLVREILSSRIKPVQVLCVHKFYMN